MQTQFPISRFVLYAIPFQSEVTEPQTSRSAARYFFSLARSNASAIAPPGCGLGSGARLGSDGRGPGAGPPERDDVPDVSSRRNVREMRWRFTSTSITFNWRIWPV